MTQLQSDSMRTKGYPRQRGRIFPDLTIPLAEQAKQKAADEAFYQRCTVIFERVRPDLIEAHYNWFIAIEPDSGEYWIDLDEDVAWQQAQKQHPQTIIMMMRLNETGTCGRI